MATFSNYECEVGCPKPEVGSQKMLIFQASCIFGLQTSGFRLQTSVAYADYLSMLNLSPSFPVINFTSKNTKLWYKVL